MYTNTIIYDFYLVKL